jgi:hypothetical protein
MRRNNRRNDMEACEFHGIWSGADAATQVLLNLNPSNMSAAGFTRLGGFADNFASFKIQRLRFRIHCNNATSGTAACFVGSVQDTSPSTLPQVMEVLPAAILGLVQQVPTNWVEVPKADLAGPLTWYKSLLGTADATEESPGLLVLVHTTLVAYTVEIEGNYLFKTAVAPANTPMALKLAQEIRASRVLAAQDRERVALRRLLQGAVSSPTAMGPMG